MSAMLLPFRARLLVILVAIVTCRPVNKRSISTLPLQSAASPQQAIETKPQKPTQAQPIQKQWSNTLTFRTHPINYYETINYDLPKHRPLIARDVFRRGYLKVFSTYSRIYLRETYEISNDDWFNGGTAARRRNFGNWNLVPDGVLISFEDYQVSSHNFGQPELIVPYSRLRRVLRSSVTRHYIRP